jgi:hypothetical protein
MGRMGRRIKVICKRKDKFFNNFLRKGNYSRRFNKNILMMKMKMILKHSMLSLMIKNNTNDKYYIIP